MHPLFAEDTAHEQLHPLRLALLCTVGVEGGHARVGLTGPNHRVGGVDQVASRVVGDRDVSPTALPFGMVVSGVARLIESIRGKGPHFAHCVNREVAKPPGMYRVVELGNRANLAEHGRVRIAAVVPPVDGLRLVLTHIQFPPEISILFASLSSLRALSSSVSGFLGASDKYALEYRHA